MTEISFVATEIAASRQRGIPTDEGKLWETLRLDAERAAEALGPRLGEGEILVTIGAGDIFRLADRLVGEGSDG